MSRCRLPQRAGGRAGGGRGPLSLRPQPPVRGHPSGLVSHSTRSRVRSRRQSTSCVLLTAAGGRPAATCPGVERCHAWYSPTTRRDGEEVSSQSSAALALREEGSKTRRPEAGRCARASCARPGLSRRFVARTRPKRAAPPAGPHRPGLCWRGTVVGAEHARFFPLQKDQQRTRAGGSEGRGRGERGAGCRALQGMKRVSAAAPHLTSDAVGRTSGTLVAPLPIA